MSLKGYINFEVDLAVSELVDELTDEDIIELYNGLDRSGDRTHAELARNLATAIEKGNEAEANDLLHRLCFDLGGLPVTRPVQLNGIQRSGTG